MKAIMCSSKIIKKKIWVHSFHEFDGQLAVYILHLFHIVTEHTEKAFHIICGACSGMLWGKAFLHICDPLALSAFDVSGDSNQSFTRKPANG